MHDLYPNFQEETPITTSSENEILLVDFGDFIKDSERWWIEVDILHSSATQEDEEEEVGLMNDDDAGLDWYEGVEIRWYEDVGII